MASSRAGGGPTHPGQPSGRRSVLFVGVDYFTFRTVTHLNWWHSFLERLAPRLETDLPVLSLNLRAADVERQGPASPSPLVYNVRPLALGGRLPAGTYRAAHYVFAFPLGPLRRSLSLQRRLGLLEELIARHGVSAVHFIDNFGAAMGMVKRRHPELLVTASLPTWRERLGPLRFAYRALQRRSFDGLDAVVTGSAATASRMHAAGFPPARVHVIPWSIAPRGSLDPDARRRGRERLGLSPAVPLLLWTGFTQCSRPEDLAFSVQLARGVRERDPGAQCICAFKPTDLQPRHLQLAGDGVQMLETDQATFQELLAAADLLLSPITEPGRTVTPPLTWLEAMDLGVPVVTTPADGAADTLAGGESGLIVDSPAQGARLVGDLLADEARLAVMRQQARRTVAARFSLQSAVDQYVELWGLEPVRDREQLEGRL